MTDDIMYRVAELERIVGSMIRMGTIAEVDYDNALCRVRSGGILTGWLQWATTRAMGEKTWWAPRIGEQVMVFSPCGDLAQGKVMMAFYQDAATPPANLPDIHRYEYPDGAFIEYDEDTGTLTADVPGHIVANAAKTASVKAGEVLGMEAPLINLLGILSSKGPGGGDGEATFKGVIKVNRIECDSISTDSADVGDLTSASSHADVRSGGAI